MDNFAFGGEVSPIVIVALLFVATAASGVVWGSRAWPVTITAWFCLPLAHLIKHIIGMPDTIHPNTYVSILMLGVFTFVIAAVGSGCGIFLHRFIRVETKPS